MTARTRCMYSFSATATTFTARAHRDLDCDGIYSQFQVTGAVDAMGTLQVAPLTVMNEFE